jgi:hypothetical protein
MITQLPRQLDETTSLGRDSLWNRIRATLSDMNYACRRMIELQAIVDDQSR